MRVQIECAGFVVCLRLSASSCHAGVVSEIGNEMSSGLGDVHQESGEEVGGIEGSGRRKSTTWLRLVQDAALLIEAHAFETRPARLRGGRMR